MENYFKDLFESIPDFRKIVLLIFLIENDADLLQECGFLKSDINRLILKCKNLSIEQHGEYLDYVKKEESAIEKFSNK